MLLSPKSLGLRPARKHWMSSRPILLKNTTPSTGADDPLPDDVAALAIIIAAFAHGLRPDLDPGYLFEYCLSLVQEMTAGEAGISNVDAEMLGQLVSDGARLPGKDDVQH